MSLRTLWMTYCVISVASVCNTFLHSTAAAESNTVDASAEAFVNAFNDAKPEVIVSLFMPDGELVDEEGNIYQGAAQLKELFAGYFVRNPGATLRLALESTRMIGSDLAIEEGTRYVSTTENATGQVRYVAVRVKQNDKWYIASLREFYDQAAPSSGERLATLAWIEGDWISEDAEGSVKISYRWTEDRNFLVGDFSLTNEGAVTVNTTQRIGWDPRTGTVRSWVFDSDGGFAEGMWSQDGDSWVIKSTSTLPDATTGTATVQLTPIDKDRFNMTGRDRFVAGGRLDDFNVTVTRAPPEPKK